MTVFQRFFIQIKSVEELSEIDSIISSQHSTSKILITLWWILVVISNPQMEYQRLFVYFGITIALYAIAHIPIKHLFIRCVFVLPLIIFFVLGNIIFQFNMIGFVLSINLVLKTLTTIGFTLLLVATTKSEALENSLRAMHVPNIFVEVVTMIFRYLRILVEEAGNLHRAYEMRSGEKHIQIRHMGSLLGGLLVRSLDRSEHIYESMKCRGYNGSMPMVEINKMDIMDHLVWISAIFAITAIRLFP